MIIKAFQTVLVFSALLLATPLAASADPAREYCKREFPEILEQCVLQEWEARVRVRFSDAEPFIISSCKEMFSESYAMQDACIRIKEDQAHGLNPPGEAI